MKFSPMFIALEGIDGCGKSTQSRLLAEKLSEHNSVICVREPGGSPQSSELRDFILSKDRPDFGVIGNALLFEVSRVHTIDTVISPAIESGSTVICDRYVHSGFAYSGVLLEHDGTQQLMQIAEAVCPFWPDITFFLDIPVSESILRRNGKEEDRIESRGTQYLEKVRAAYKTFVNADPLRETACPTFTMYSGLNTFIEVDGMQSPELVTEEMTKHILEYVDRMKLAL